MDIEGSDGSKTLIKPNSTTVFGRENGFHPKDLTVSRRHISFDLNQSDNQTVPRVSFEVLGKNPVWVYSKKENGKIRVFKRFQRGELGTEDMFCVSAKNPIWFTMKKVDDEESNRGEIRGTVNTELSQSLETASSSGFNGSRDFGFDSVDVSNIDPVQEFGFLVIGHEFDQYPKQMIREIKNWDWFLEDTKGDSDDEDVSDKKGKRGGRRKRKKSRGGDDDVDDDWTGESEDEKLVSTKTRKVQTPNYLTRSKDRGKPLKGRTNRTSSMKTSSEEEKDECEDEDEDDETLGGFIVDEETVEEEEEVEDEEEEEFIEDEDELED